MPLIDALIEPIRAADPVRFLIGALLPGVGVCALLLVIGVFARGERKSVPAPVLPAALALAFCLAYFAVHAAVPELWPPDGPKRILHSVLLVGAAVVIGLGITLSQR